MNKRPIEVSGLRKAPAIVVNIGDEIRARCLPYPSHWGTVAALAFAPHAVSVIAENGRGYVVKMDEIEEWRKG